MAVKKPVVATLLMTSLAWPIAPVSASDCAQTLDQVTAQARSFQAEAQTMSMGFARDEYLKALVDGAKRSLKPADKSWNPAMGSQEEAVTAFQAGKAKLLDWKNKVETWNSQMVDIKRCVNDPNCSLLDLSNRLNRDLRQWLASLGSGRTAEAAERVNQAASLLEGYSARLEGAAETSIGSAIACMDQNSPLPQASPEPVDLSGAQAGAVAAGAAAGSTPAPAAGASSAGSTAATHGPNVALRVAAGVVAVGGGVLVGKKIADSVSSNSGTNTASCPSAATLAATAGGGIVAVGNDTICTQYYPCGSKTSVRSCAAHICDLNACSIYYEFAGGGRVVCTTGCNAATNSAGMTSAIMNCATRAAGACQ